MGAAIADMAIAPVRTAADSDLSGKFLKDSVLTKAVFDKNFIVVSCFQSIYGISTPKVDTVMLVNVRIIAAKDSNSWQEP